MSFYVLAFLIGVVAGLRAMTAPAAVSWAARLGWLNLAGSPLAFLGFAWTPYIVTLLALGELVNDKLPKTPSRKSPPQFIARILSGALCGAAIGADGGALAAGLVAGTSERSPERSAATRSAPGSCGRSGERTCRSRCSRTPARSLWRSGPSAGLRRLRRGSGLAQIAQHRRHVAPTPSGGCAWRAGSTV